jgi:hypothetical protein
MFMRNFAKLFAAVVLLAGAMAMMPGAAQAQHWHGGHGGWHRGWGPGFGFGYPYYGGPYAYSGGPSCGWVRVWRGGGYYRRVWRCW